MLTNDHIQAYWLEQTGEFFPHAGIVLGMKIEYYIASFSY